MKMRPALIILAVIASVGAVAADEPNPGTAVRPSNPFALPPFEGSSNFDGEIAKEDVSSPFSIAHRVEEMLYLGMYGGRYDARFPSFATPLQTPKVNDAQGRPLWFDAETGRDVLANIAAGLFESEQFDALDTLFDDWNEPSEVRADGRRKLMSFDHAIATQFAVGASWDVGYQRIQQWRRKSPTSRAAALAEAIYWSTCAFNARGSGYASSVTPEGWKLFEERLAKAEATLDGSESYASSSPLWNYEYIRLAGNLGWPVARRMGIFRSAYEADRSFVANYTASVRYLAPKWGGDWGLVDDFVKFAVDLTKETEGTSMYARLYVAVDECGCSGFSLFRDTRVSWPKLKSAFEDLIRLYPHSAWNMNEYAAYACMAGDKASYVNIRFRLGRAVIAGAWPQTYSLDSCEHQFAAQPL
jgi:hypothetical protein